MIPPPQLTVEEFLKEYKQYPLVDVRSPVEYKNGHIPGAVNIPLFDDHERAEIGTIYKLRGKEDAVLRGLEIVSPKLADFVKSVKSLDKKDRVYVYCFRGGMRSNSFATLMNTAGVKASVVKGGYKAYRKASLEFYSQNLPILLLGGATGSGKTSLLRELKNMGEQVIDLEALAGHKGSAFGAVPGEQQPTQQLFENLLFQEFKQTRGSERLWLEDESFCIGSVKLPYPLWLQMKKAPLIKIELPFSLRIQRLIQEYGQTDKETLKNTILRIRKRLGDKDTRETLQYLENQDAEKVAATLLNYYDSAYRHDHEKKKEGRMHTLKLHENDAVKNARYLLDLAQQLHE